MQLGGAGQNIERSSNFTHHSIVFLIVIQAFIARKDSKVCAATHAH